jgi:Repeat of unknown function (DUF5648)
MVAEARIARLFSDAAPDNSLAGSLPAGEDEASRRLPRPAGDPATEDTMGTGKGFALAALVAATICLFPLRSVGEVHLLQLYSTWDGEYQAILLEDDENDGVDRFTGLRFEMYNERWARSLTLTPDLVRDREVVVDGKRRFLVATRQVASQLITQAELPDGFLATDGGIFEMLPPGSPVPWVTVVDLAYAIRFEPGTGYPIAWNDALARHPPASPQSPATGADSFVTTPPAPVVREYYNASMDRYFLAVSHAEKAVLDFGGRRGWQRTGKYFRSLPSGPTNRSATVPVCRYYLPPPLGDIHFFSAFAEECEAMARQWPDAILETHEAFRVALPEPGSGECLPAVSAHGTPLLTTPVYRSWDAMNDTGHRYTTSLAEQTERIRRGWIAEGYGPWGSVMCVDEYTLGTIEVPKQKPKTPRRDESR